MIRLFVNSYSDPDPARQAELDECLRRNREHPYIGEVLQVTGGRATYKLFFEVINGVVAADDVSIIANADIGFDGSVERCLRIKSNQVYALTRWDASTDFLKMQIFCDDNGNPRVDSQDAWIFRGPVRPVADCDFPLGRRGCDNAIAARLAAAGYEVRNPSLWIRALHLHQTGIRRYGHEQQDMVPRPYLLITPATIDEVPQHRWCL